MTKRSQKSLLKCHLHGIRLCKSVVFIHQEVIIPKSYMPLSKVSAFTGALNGNKLLDNVVH
jgi:hypothetical protein